MVCAACCHVTLVSAVMHLYDILQFFIASVHSFFYTFFESGIDKSTEWSTIPACPSLMCFFNRGDTEGTNSSKILCPMFVYVLCGFVSCLILWFVDDLRFDDLGAE